MEQVITRTKDIYKKPDNQTEVIEALDKSNWTPVTFGEVCQNLNVTERDPLGNGIERYVGLEHMESNSLYIKSWGNVANGTTFTKKFNAGHVLFGKRRAYLRKAAIADFDGVCSGDILVFEAKEDVIDPNLFPFLVQSDRFFDFAMKTSAGSLSPRTKFQDLARFEFRLPPRAQQAKLAELLWASDDVVENYLNLKYANDDLIKVYRERKLYKQENKRVRLSSLLTRITAGKSLNGKSIPVNNKEEYGVLKVSAVGPNGFDRSENKCLINQSEFRKDLAVKMGDLLITRANTTELVGRVCLVDQDYSNLMLSDKTLRLELDDNKCNKVFIHEVLKSKIVREQIEGTATGTGGAMKNISQDEIRNIFIPHVPKEMQDQESNIIMSLKTQIKQIDTSIDSFRIIQRLLINQIFS